MCPGALDMGARGTWSSPPGAMIEFAVSGKTYVLVRTRKALYNACMAGKLALLCACILALIGAGPIPALQLGNYPVVVTVRGANFKGISGAMVEIKGPGPSLARRTTDGDGFFSAVFAYPGEYTISVSHPSYSTFSGRFNLKVNGSTFNYSIRLRATDLKVRIPVMVISEDRKEPIVGASVVGTRDDASGSDRMTTDPSGQVVMIMSARELAGTKGLTISVTASHPDFESATQSVTAAGAEGQYPLTFLLKRKAGLRVAVINLFEKGSRAPIVGASVILDGGTTGYLTGTTDGEGRASITVSKAGVYRLSVASDYYESVSDSLSFVGADVKAIERTYDLARKDSVGEYFRMAAIKVRGKGPDGKLVPLKEVSVTLSTGTTQATNAAGNLNVLHNAAPGETLTATVAASSDGTYKAGSGSVVVGARGVLLNSIKFKGYLKGYGRNALYRALTPDLVQDFISLAGNPAVDPILIVCETDGGQQLDGSIAVNKGVAKVGEKVNVVFRLLYKGEQKPDKLPVNEQVELYGPNGKKITTSSKSRVLTRNAAFDSRYLNITADEPGTYTVKAKAKGGAIPEWKGQVSFDVRRQTAAKPADGVWVCERPKTYCLSASQNLPEGQNLSYLTTTPGGVSFNDGEKGGNAQISGIPNQLKPGDVVKFTISTSNMGASLEAADAAEGQHSWGAKDPSSRPSVSGSFVFKPRNGRTRIVISFSANPFSGPYTTSRGNIVWVFQKR